MIEFVELTEADALYIAKNMRASDKAECEATQFHEEGAETLALEHAACVPTAWCARLDGEPVALVGATPSHPGVWSVFMFATDKFPRVGLQMTKFVIRRMMPSLRAAGAHRAHCFSAASHHHAHAWLRLLGATEEATLRRYGRDGSDFKVFSWITEHVQSPQGPIC